jgi:uncharacterized protein (TIGR03435 family)
MMLITRAYGLNSFQVLGAPELNTTRFDILAKLPAGSSAKNKDFMNGSGPAITT